MNVFVTGGTGFVGRHVLARLSSAGHSIRLLARDPGSRAAQWAVDRFQARIYRGDILIPESLNPVCSGADAVIHLVGIISEAGKSTFEQVHVEGTRNVVEAAKGCGIGRFIHMSALGTRADAVARYHQTKWKAENLVRSSGLACTIFRPSIIYGAGDGFVSMFEQMSRFSPVLPVIGRGKGKYQLVPVETVADAFVKALSEPRSMGETYDLGGREAMSLNQVLDVVMESGGWRRVKIHLPVWLARAGAVLMEVVYGRVLRMPPPLTRDQIQMLQEDNVGDPSKAIELFDLQIPPLREGLARRRESMVCDFPM